LQGAVRSRDLLLAQTTFAREATYAAVEAEMAKHLCNDGNYRIPMPTLLGVGTK